MILFSIGTNFELSCSIISKPMLLLSYKYMSLLSYISLLSYSCLQVCSVTSLEGRQPERVFKVVLLGDSAVGKSSFIMRLCHNRFQAAFQPTIGVDFQVWISFFGSVVLLFFKVLYRCEKFLELRHMGDS